MPFCLYLRIDTREEFFQSIVLLLERQLTDQCRKKVIMLLLELSVVELKPPANPRADDTSSTYEQNMSFGFLAFQTLADIMPSVAGLHKLFFETLEEVRIHSPSHACR